MAQSVAQFAPSTFLSLGGTVYSVATRVEGASLPCSLLSALRVGTTAVEMANTSAYVAKANTLSNAVPGWREDGFEEYFLSATQPGEVAGVLHLARKDGGAWTIGLAKSFVPYVLTKDAVERGAIPGLGASMLPAEIEACIPTQFQYWKAASLEDALRIRDELFEQEIVTDRLVKVVDGRLHLLKERLFLADPAEQDQPLIDDARVLALATAEALMGSTVKTSPLAQPEWETALIKAADAGEGLLLSPTGDLAPVVDALLANPPQGPWIIEHDDTQENRALLTKLGPVFHLPGVFGRVFAASNVPALAKLHTGRTYDLDFTPPEDVREACKQGLAKIKEAKCLPTVLGWAKKIADGKPITASKALQIYAWHCRDRKRSEADVLLWGGTAAKAWTEKLAKQIEERARLAKAVWTTAYINDLPDSAFLHIADGGELDEEGKTTPRSLRFFPVYDEAGKLDLPHLRNALARIPQASISAEAKLSAKRKGEKLLADATTTKKVDVKVLKVESPEEQFILGIVLEPDVVDAQKDTYSADEIRKAAHNYMLEHQTVGLMHKEAIPEKAQIVESYLVPTDTEINGRAVKAGTWVMGVKVFDDALWTAVKNGEITGFSIGGTAARNPL